MTTGNFSNLVSEVLLTENSSGNFSNLVSEVLLTENSSGNFSNLVSEVLLTENSSGNFSNLVSETLVETVFNLSYKTVVDNNKRANSFSNKKFTSTNEQPTFIPISSSGLGWYIQQLTPKNLKINKFEQPTTVLSDFQIRWMVQQGEPHYNRPHVQKNEFSQTLQITYYHRCPPILRNHQ